MRQVAFLTLLVFCLGADRPGKPQSEPETQIKVFVNGRWFDGGGFAPKTFYAVNGLLTLQKPAGQMQTVDLHGRFVVPPFADGHNHSPSSKHDVEAASEAFLNAGVFYVLNAGGNAESANPIRTQLGTPSSIDVIFADALFTCHGGHPRPYLEYLIDRGDLPYSKEELEGRFFNSVDSKVDLDRIWPKYLATKPDFVKMVFVFSEFYRTGKGKTLGLRPDVAKDIVHRAQQAGLRSGAHIESAVDFHNAIAAGVDAVMHLPCFPDPIDRQAAYAEKADWEQRYTIPDADIELAKERSVTVVTTAAACSAENFEKPNPLAEMNDNERRFRKITIENLRHLKDAGVALAIGSDTTPGAGVLTEVNFLHETEVFSNLELLKMWSEITPRVIYPKRKIGALKEGYEANFLVLGGNPITDFSQIQKIVMRVKHGQVL